MSEDDNNSRMFNRRNETRMLCADLVDVQWKDKSGKKRTSVANLEDISLSGACIQMEIDVPLGTVMKITLPKGGFEGTVKYCVFREIGYYVGIEFAENYRWSPRTYKPRHMLDPRRLVIRALKSAKQAMMLPIQ